MPPPLRFFCDAPRTMRPIVLKFCIAYGASFAQLLVKNFDRVMSGHGTMTSQEVQGQAIFARNSGIWLIRRRYRGFEGFTVLRALSPEIFNFKDLNYWLMEFPLPLLEAHSLAYGINRHLW